MSGFHQNQPGCGPHSLVWTHHLVSTWWVVKRSRSQGPVEVRWHCFLCNRKFETPVWLPLASEWRLSSFMCLQGPLICPIAGPHLALSALVVWKEFMSAISTSSSGLETTGFPISSILGVLGVLVIFHPTHRPNRIPDYFIHEVLTI